MSAISDLLGSTSTSAHLRPLDVRRDLAQVADLVEQCFADSLDVDGQRYIQQMRSMARNPGYLGWLSTLAERSPVPYSGFVWEEDGRVVGNLTLIPYSIANQRHYLIANVAVYPEYRRRGIARQLTARALEYCRQRNIPTTWLHVREDNEAAVRLYTSLGFVERARRTTWYSNGQPMHTAQSIPSTSASRVQIGPRRAEDWSLQRHWLARLYPAELTWHLALKSSALRPGLRGFLYRLFNEIDTRQWSARRGKRLIGVLAWHSTQTYADNLWLATDAEDEDEAAWLLLSHARQHLSPRRPLSLDYPASQADQAIEQAGFHKHQTLIWMSAETVLRNR